MKKRLLAFSIACAVLFAEGAAVCSSAAAAASLTAEAGDSAQEEAAKPKKITVKAYQITSDQVKVLLYKTELDPATQTYSTLLDGLYPSYSSSSSGSSSSSSLPDDTVRITDWFASPEGYQKIKRYGELISDEDHSIYYMTKEVPVHYLRFDAGDGKLIWTNSKQSYTGNVREIAENEMVIPDQDSAGYRMPDAVNGDRAFLGWFTEPEGGVQLKNDTAVTGDKEQTYYAHWDEEGTASERNYYIVTKYSANNEDGVPHFFSQVRVNKGETYARALSGSGLSAARPSNVNKDDYEPGTAVAYDWYSEKDGGFIIDYNSTEPLTGDTEIYYRKGIFPCHYISFDAGEGELFWNVYSASYYEGNVPAAKSCELTAMEDHKLSSGLPKAEYGTHKFLGWFTEPEGGTQFDTTTVYKEKGDLKLYAHYDEEGTTEAPKGIKVRIYNVDSETGALRVSFDYRGEDCASYYEVMYGKNSTSYVKSAAAAVATSGMTIPEGMTYQSAYFSEAEGGQEISLHGPLLKNEDHAIYSRYDLIPYHHILFDANGGKVFWNGYKSTTTYYNDRKLKDDEIVLVKGGMFNRLPEALNGTRKFLGWFTEPDGGEKIEERQYFNGDKDTTYYAHWDEEGTAAASDDVIMKCYNKSYNATDYTLYGSYRVKKDATYSSAAATAPKLSVYVSQEQIPEGKIPKVFWYSEAEGGFCANRSTDPVPDHDFALYSRTEMTGFHYVTFDPNGGDLSNFDEEAAASGFKQGAMTTTAVYYSSSTSTTTVRQPATNEIMVTEGNTYGKMLRAYQDNKEFLGWFTDPVGGIRITENTVFTGTADQTLYAHWSGAQTDPAVTTAPALTTTAVPATTTAEIKTTTAKVTTTTAKATTTTAKATTTTAKATTTTAKATTTTAKATTTTAKATTTTAQATTTTAKATSSTAKATTTTAKATTTTAKATTTTAKATTTTAKATTTTTQVTTTTAKATTTTATATTTAKATTTTAQATTTASETTVQETTFPVQTTTAAPAEPEVLTGDVNDDGDVSVDDAQLALKAYTKRIAGLDMGLTARQIKAANVNGDAELSVDDAQLILKYYTQKKVAGKDITWDDLLVKKSAAQTRLVPKQHDLFTEYDKDCRDLKQPELCS